MACGSSSILVMGICGCGAGVSNVFIIMLGVVRRLVLIYEAVHTLSGLGLELRWRILSFGTGNEPRG
jgi:hypothetical protein